MHLEKGLVNDNDENMHYKKGRYNWCLMSKPTKILYKRSDTLTSYQSSTTLNENVSFAFMQYLFQCQVPQRVCYEYNI